MPALAPPGPVPTDRGQQSGLAKHSPLLEAALPSAALVGWTDSQGSLTAVGCSTKKRHDQVARETITSSLLHELTYS